MYSIMRSAHTHIRDQLGGGGVVWIEVLRILGGLYILNEELNIKKKFERSMGIACRSLACD